MAKTKKELMKQLRAALKKALAVHSKAIDAHDKAVEPFDKIKPWEDCIQASREANRLIDEIRRNK